MVGTIRRITAAMAAMLAFSGFAVALPATASSALADPGPALQTPAATLQSALSCSSDLAAPAKTPILLIPGTIESAESAYSWGYKKVLTSAGHPVCVIKSLPNHGSGDMQTTVEWVVHAIRYMHSTSGTKISTIGHSQGGMLTAWALRFWPDLASKVDDVILLGAPATGSKLADWICGSSCPRALWQIQPSSGFNAALNRYPLPSGPSISAIASTSDGLLLPATSGTNWTGATKVMVQDLCPDRTVNHLGLLWDAATHALVMDALSHSGPASLVRTGKSSCSKSEFDGLDHEAMTKLINIVREVIDALLDAEYIADEPPLRDYALGKPGDTNLSQGKPVHVSSTQNSSYPGANAVDGRSDTRWSSQWSDPQWIAVDLGATRKVNGVQLQWEDAYATAYRILLSHDGENWTTAWSTTSGRGGNAFIPLDGVSTRYIAMHGTQRDTWYGYSLWEFTTVGS